MHASYILRADILDIIFENRNKDYGAYALRKFYDQKVLKSLAIVTIFLGIFSFIVLTTKNAESFYPGKEIDISPGAIQPKVAVAVTKADPVTARPEKSSFNKIVFVDSLIKIDSLPPDDRLVNAGPADIGAEPPFTYNSDGGDGNVLTTPLPPPTVPVVPVVDVTRPLEKADIDPVYPDGMKALTKFLERNLQNPEEISEKEIISVRIKFVVGYDGELKSFEVKEDGGDAFNNEVIRVLKKMPRWIPGKTNGQNVSVYFTIPVKFINGQ